MAVKLPFALKDGKVVEISSVERGLKCGCICPACNNPLIARKKRDYDHNYTDHFAHIGNLDCPHALETIFHHAAKQILQEKGHLNVPAVLLHINEEINEPHLIQGEQSMSFDKVYIEKRVSDIIPDVIIEVDNVSFLVEIYVTHKIDQVKKEKIRKLNMSTIEIDVNKYRGIGALDNLENEIIEKTSNKQWIYNSTVDDRRRKIERHIKVRKVVSNGFIPIVAECPTLVNKRNEKMVAGYSRHCKPCPFLYGIIQSEEGSVTSVQCLGHAKDEIDLIIRGIDRWEQLSLSLD